MHEVNQSVIGVLTDLTTRSPATMCELRKLFLLIEKIDIKIKTTCIRSATNIWTDNLNRVKDNSDRKLKERKF